MQLKLIADENIDSRIIKKLKSERFTILSIQEMYPSIPDIQVLNLSNTLNSILITEDRDFGEWIFSHKKETKGVIYLRYKSTQLHFITNSLIKILHDYNIKLYNKFTVITINKIRIRELI